MSEAKSCHQPAATSPFGVPAWGERRQLVLDRYLALLVEERSPLLEAGPNVASQLASQFLAVVDEAAGEGPADSDEALSGAIGRSRAASGIHPSVSLDAARLIFVAALPALTDHWRCHSDAQAETTAAVRLNSAILSRMAAAAADYVGYLLDKADKAHREEALRLSRDLHDAVGPCIAVAIQSLDLAARYREAEPTRATEKLDMSRRALDEAATSLRTLAAETRVVLEPGSVAIALERYIADLPDQIDTQLRFEGDLSVLPQRYEREVFLIVREAIRNAVRHSGTSTILVGMALHGTKLQCWVQDQGRGMVGIAVPGGTGLASMNERAALLGATLEVKDTGAGTKVLLEVPLPARRMA